MEILDKVLLVCFLKQKKWKAVTLFCSEVLNSIELNHLIQSKFNSFLDFVPFFKNACENRIVGFMFLSCHNSRSKLLTLDVKRYFFPLLVLQTQPRIWKLNLILSDISFTSQLRG